MDKAKEIFEATSTLIEWTLYSHLIGAGFFLAIILYNYYVISNEENFVRLAKTIQKNTPYFHALNFLMFYTGIVLITLLKIITFEMVLMIFTSLYLMISEIKRWKKQRVIKSKEKQKQLEYKSWAKKHYLIQAFVLILTYIVAKII